ncbi:hypothetical protein [Metallosphaera sedula]|uniref:hypothetical protein n=1 Tax=Metallosphaera sedula TaxID=43687 RepID=UPI0020BD5F1E|nr:hypothetical protein [Metallosphaera sedula]BBL45978.1 hypothetical protein MJ1HA_0065 [Metallosphaera sedula]
MSDYGFDDLDYLIILAIGEGRETPEKIMVKVHLLGHLFGIPVPDDLILYDRVKRVYNKVSGK